MSQFQVQIFSFLLLVGVYSQSDAMPPRPAKCPSVAVIKSAGLSYTDTNEEGYVAYQINHYTTSSLWAFGVGGISASSSEEAISIGYQALVTLNGSPTPVAIPAENVWACLYSNSSGLLSVAFTPIPLAAKLNQTIKNFR